MQFYRSKKAAFLYGRAKNQYSNPYFKSQKNIESRRRLVYNLLLISIAFAAWSYFLFFSSFFKIIDWDIRGLKGYDKKDVESSLKNFLGKKELAFLPIENIFIFNEANFEKQISSQFAFQNIKVRKYYPNKIILNFREKTRKMAVYNTDKIYVLSDDGAITAIKEGISNWYSNTEQETATGTLNLGEVLADSRNKALPPYPIFCDAYSTRPANLQVSAKYPLYKIIKIASDFIDNIKEKTQLDIKSACIIKNKIGPKIIISTTNNWTIYLNSEDDGVKQFYKLYLVLNNELKDLAKPVEYIDLRFGERVYIK